MLLSLGLCLQCPYGLNAPLTIAGTASWVDLGPYTHCRCRVLDRRFRGGRDAFNRKAALCHVRDGFSRALSRVHRRFGTPHVNILVQNLRLWRCTHRYRAGLIELSVLTLLPPTRQPAFHWDTSKEMALGSCEECPQVFLSGFYLLLNTTPGPSRRLLGHGGVPHLIFRKRI